MPLYGHFITSVFFMQEISCQLFNKLLEDKKNEHKKK